MIIKSFLYIVLIWVGSLVFGFLNGFYQKWKIIEAEKKAEEFKGLFKWKQN